jgi:predicted PurR-regulated permease PerM
MKWWLPSWIKKVYKPLQRPQRRYVNGNNTKEVVEYIKNALNNIQNRIWSNKNFQSQFQWFLGLFFVFFISRYFPLERKKTSWVNKLNLFNENKKNDKNIFSLVVLSLEGQEWGKYTYFINHFFFLHNERQNIALKRTRNMLKINL